jgi:hypothetical protein
LDEGVKEDDNNKKEGKGTSNLLEKISCKLHLLLLPIIMTMQQKKVNGLWTMGWWATSKNQPTKEWETRQRDRQQAHWQEETQGEDSFL